MNLSQFKTKRDAIAAGYREPVKGRDKDISGQDSYGYTYEDAEGNRTVTVSLTEEKNKIGRRGVYAPMFPPKDN